MKTRTRRTIGRVAVVVCALVALATAAPLVQGSPGPGRGLPEEKGRLLEQEERTRAETPIRPKPLTPRGPGPAVPSDADWPQGIFDDGEFPSPDYRFVNRWTGTVGDRHVTVYAGAYAADPSRGLVLVMAVSRDLKAVEAREYPAPGGGALRIVAEGDLRLSLVSVNGARLEFDVLSRRFFDR